MKRHIPKLLTILLFAAVGGYIVLRTNAQIIPPASNYSGEAFISYMPGHDGNYQADEILSAWVTGGGSSLPGGPTTGQLRLILFSDSNYVDYLGYTCDPNITCYQSGWDNPTAIYNGRKDLKLCITLPVAHAQAGQPLPHLLTLNYKVKGPTASSFLLKVDHSAGGGTCQSNPSASGVVYSGRSAGACFNNRFGGAGCSGSNIGFMGADPNGFSDKTGQQGESPNQNLGTSQTPNNSSSAGGSSAQNQANNPNEIPSSSSQGESEQPELEPSPFFDGQEFNSGSDADTLGSTVSTTGRKVIRTWPLILGVVVFGGVTGYALWRWRHRH